jgi:carbonic anhydrase
MGSILWSGQTYTAIQFTFHQPAEHLVNGQRADMEMYITHRDENTSSILNFALLFNVEAGALDNKFLGSIGYDNPVLGGLRSFAPIGEVNLMELFLGGDMSKVRAWEYSGSLTIPPCTEGQKFLVFKEQRVMSRKQWDGFARAVGHGIDWEKKTGNFRDTEPKNDRKVLGRTLALRNKDVESRQDRELFGYIAMFVVPVIWFASRRP